MTAPPPNSVHTDPAAAEPPPGCPAHGRSPVNGLARLHGPEHQHDPMGLYEELRKEHGSVAPVLIEGDLPAWLVLGYRENLEVTRSPAKFSRDSRRWTMFRQGRVPADYPLLPVIGWQPLCVFADGAEHERLRAAMTEAMGRFNRRGIRKHVTRLADQLIDAFSVDGQADLVSQFAEQLPLRVATRLFGMPDEYGPRLVTACRDLMVGTATAQASNDFITATMEQLVARKRAVPGADLASWLIEHPSNLTDDEIVQHLRFGLLAANENTIVLIGSTLRMMLTDRRFRASLAGGQMTLPDAVEQLLWDEPPLVVLPGRWATGDTELGGQKIEEGDMLLIGIAAGNADPAVRPDPPVPMHGNRSHLAFSRGPHECPGQDIGRAITETAVDTLLTRLPDLQLAVDPSELRQKTSWMYRQLQALPVRFEPRRPLLTHSHPGTTSPSAGRGTTPLPALPQQGSCEQPNPDPSTPCPKRSWRTVIQRLLPLPRR